MWKHLIYEMSKISEVFIDTDSQEVLDECEADERLSTVTAYPRDKAFVEMEEDSNSSLSPALLMVENFLSKFVEDDSEVIVLTHVTSPFLKSETVEIFEPNPEEYKKGRAIDDQIEKERLSGFNPFKWRKK